MDLKQMWRACGVYQVTWQHDRLAETVQKILNLTDDPEEQAKCYHWLGECAELRKEYDAALKYYAEGQSLNPFDKTESYFLHNNSGYCLSIKGQYKEAETMCRKAIEIDSDRHNAWKNLGISLEGQEDFVGAAYAYLEATYRKPEDERALKLLEKLLHERQFPETFVAQFSAVVASLGKEKRQIQ
jgi:tetratricopeptide (TPR) repeat protein